MSKESPRRVAKTSPPARALVVRHVFPAPGRGAPPDGFHRVVVDWLAAEFEAWEQTQRPASAPADTEEA